MEVRRLASTQETFYGLMNETIERENCKHGTFLSRQQGSGFTYPQLTQPGGEVPLLETAEHSYNFTTTINWCADASSLVTLAEDNAIRVYIAPPALEECDNELLVPYIRYYNQTHVTAMDLHPQSSLYDGFCTCMVVSNGIPLKLKSLIPDEDGSYSTLQSYSILNDQTEKYHKVHTVKFIDPVTCIAGSNHGVSWLDINRSEPILSVPLKDGIVSCVTPSKNELTSSNSCYTGTLSNYVHAWDSNGNLVNYTKLPNDAGNGITQILESDNGRYLYVVSRNSNEIHQLDLRMALKLVCTLGGFSSSNQRINGDVLHNAAGLLIGSRNGVVNWFRDSELGLPTRPETLKVCDTSVSNIKVNPKDPTIVAMATGDRSCATPSVSLNNLYNTQSSVS